MLRHKMLLNFDIITDFAIGPLFCVLIREHICISWSGISRKTPVLLFYAEALVIKDGSIRSIGGNVSVFSVLFFLYRQIKVF